MMRVWRASLLLVLGAGLGGVAMPQNSFGRGPLQPATRQGADGERATPGQPPPAAEPAPAAGPETAPGDPQAPPPPAIPSLEEVQAGRAAITNYVPTSYNFRIGVIGDFTKEFETEAGTQTQIKTPLLLIDPSDGHVGVYAKNFPAHVVAESSNGRWVIGVAPSSAVDGSSGNRQKESAVSLDLHSGTVKLIKEFQARSKFQAVFDSRNADVFYYCVNEPASENQIIRYDLKNDKTEPVPAEGNRFYLYGLHTVEPLGMWVQDSNSVNSDPVLSLLDIKKGDVLKRVSFPGTQQIYAQPGGAALLASVSNSAEASLGYYDMSSNAFHQVPRLVLTRPSFKWLNGRMSVVAKESTSTRDRFLLVDLATGSVKELFSAYFKIAQWDVSPDDAALVFVSDSKDSPVLYVVPLDERNTAINRVSLQGVTNITWLGCLNQYKSGGSSWLDKLLPFK
jgi:hypothetical protein